MSSAALNGVLQHPRLGAIERARRVLLATRPSQYRALAVMLGTFSLPVRLGLAKIGQFGSGLKYVPDGELSASRGLRPGSEPFLDPFDVVRSGGDCEDLNLYFLGNLALQCADADRHAWASCYVFDSTGNPRHVFLVVDGEGHDVTPRGVGLRASNLGPGRQVFVPWR